MNTAYKQIPDTNEFRNLKNGGWAEGGDVGALLHLLLLSGVPGVSAEGIEAALRFV